MALLGFVCTGVLRGFKDTRTPLISAAISASASLGLNVLFIYGGCDAGQYVVRMYVLFLLKRRGGGYLGW